MTQGLNGGAPHMEHDGDDRDTRTIALTALDHAHKASGRAAAASDHAQSAHENIGRAMAELGRFAGALDGFKMAMIQGFAEFGVKLKVAEDNLAKANEELVHTRSKLASLSDGIENTEVRNKVHAKLATLRQYQLAAKWLLGVMTAIITALSIAEAVHLLGVK